MKARKVTWVLVGDASRARLFRATPGQHWTLLEHFEHPLGREHAHEYTTDRAGRIGLAGDTGLTARLVPHTDPRETEAVHFARRLCARLSRGLAEASYDDVVLVAPPHFLGILRHELEDNVKKRVLGTLAKDLSLFTTHAVRARLLGAGIDA